MKKTLKRPLGATLIAGACFAAGLAGVVTLWAVWPRTSNTSPLAALFALLWSCTHIVTAILVWRRSRFAAPAFVAAAGLLVFPIWFIVPGSQFVLPAAAAAILVALLGCRYLRKAPELRA